MVDRTLIWVANNNKCNNNNVCNNNKVECLVETKCNNKVECLVVINNKVDSNNNVQCKVECNNIVNLEDKRKLLLQKWSMEKW